MFAATMSDKRRTNRKDGIGVKYDGGNPLARICFLLWTESSYRDGQLIERVAKPSFFKACLAPSGGRNTSMRGGGAALGWTRLHCNFSAIEEVVLRTAMESYDKECTGKFRS